MLSATAYAADIETYVDFDTRDVYVSGKIDQAAFNRMVSVIISGNDEQYYVNTVKTTSDGEYTLGFRMPESADTGYYMIEVNAFGLDEPVEKEFYFAKREDIDGTLALINDARSEREVRSAVEENIAVLNIPEDWYKSLGADGKEAVAAALYASRPYQMIGDATIVANKELAVQAFRYANDGEKVEAALNRFADIYNINSETASCYDLYQKADLAKAARSIMSGYDSVSIAEVVKAFDESTLLAAVNSARDPLGISELMTEYREVIPFSLATYDKANEEKMAAYLYKSTPMKSMNALQKAIENAYKQESTQPSGGSSGGGGGGGSSSGGGGGSVRSSNSVNLPPAAAPAPTQPATSGESSVPAHDTFNDLGSFEWAKEAITYLADRNIVSGVGDNRFEPESSVTREQFVLMIVNALGFGDDEATSDFADMPKDHWAYDAVSIACEKGIIFGFSDSEFGTGKSITRQDMAVIAYRASRLAGYEFDEAGGISFSDGYEIAEYAKESIAAMSAKGIITGYPDGRFGPADTANRAQAAQIIYSIIK